MNRTDRLYALVEELRAAAPHTRTVRGLAQRLEVSERTVQRDLQALLAAGVPVRAVPGRGGGWAVDPAMTLPPIRFSADEAAALAIAMAAAPPSGAVRSALQKIAASLSGPAADAARLLAGRIVTLPPPGEPAVRAAVERAVADGTVLRLRYTDADGAASSRDVEPAGLLHGGGNWYLIAWCRTRRAARGFRLDRIASAAPTGERSAPRALADLLDGAAAGAARPAVLDPLG